MPLVDSPFQPAWWLPGPHAQTLWASLARRAPKLNLRWEEYELSDGDVVELAHVEAGPIADDAPTLLVLHGLAGSVESPHVAGLLAAGAARGWRAIGFHFRGCGRRTNRSMIGYHSGKTDDPREVLAALQARHAGPVFAAGFSLGANVLLKLLGEDGAQAPVDAAAAVSPPLVLARCAERMNRGLSRGYQRFLMGRLSEYMQAKADAGLPFDAKILPELKSFRDFDDAITAPVHGFADSADYYRQASSRPFLPRITIPTLVVHALDDPFFVPSVVPGPDEVPDCVRFEVAPHGGHVGFVSGRLPGRGRYHADVRIPRFLAAHASVAD